MPRVIAIFQEMFFRDREPHATAAVATAKLATMRWCLVVAIVVGASPAPAAPRGKVVRIDRVRLPAAIPRMCMMMTEDKMVCLGKPVANEIIHIFETDRGKPVGEIRVDSVRDFLGFRNCPGTPQAVFEVTGSVVAGSTDLLDGSQRVIGIRNAEVEAGSRILRKVSPAVRPTPADRQVELAVDFDGDGGADYVLEHYACPDPTSPARTPTRCFDTYMERRGTLQLVARDTIHVCN